MQMHVVHYNVYFLINFLTLQSFIQSFFTEKSQLERTLQSLACGKARVLTKTPKVTKEQGLILQFTLNIVIQELSQPLTL